VDATAHGGVPRNRDTGRPSVRHRDRVQRSDTRIRRIRPGRPFRFECLLVLQTNRSWTARGRPSGWSWCL